MFLNKPILIGMFARLKKFFKIAKLKSSILDSSVRLLYGSQTDKCKISVVSVSYNPAINYGNAIAPYDPENNPAYQYAFDTIIRLNLGSNNNPLGKLIKQGDKVLIKVNLIEQQTPFYTRPEIVRPLIDMCRIAGASTIQVADGSYSYSHMQDAFEYTGYANMIRELQLRHSHIPIKTVNLCERDYWQWIHMGNDSFFYNSALADLDLSSLSHLLYKTQYYSTPDSSGVNPQGHCMGWYAINKHVLDADVIINVPKLKVHGTAIMTGCLKSFVGCLINNTYEDTWHAERIPHYNERAKPNDPFSNEILWRAVGDVNKIILYADKNGRLHSSPQRKLLNFIDGIDAAEKGNRSKWSGKLCVGKILMAGTDPVAMDAVACRVMGYDFRAIPSIKKIGNIYGCLIGIWNPEQILLLGSTIDGTMSRIYEYGDEWKMYASKNNLAIPTFVPPFIKNEKLEFVNASLRITANISRAAVAAYILYTVNGNMSFIKMKRNGSSFTVEIERDDILEYTLAAHDKYFNASCKTNQIVY